MSGSCSLLWWDGAEDSIFCLSSSTAAGYEIGKTVIILV